MRELNFSTTAELVPLLAERGVNLSRMQVYRLVMQEPQRLSLDLLAALCDILSCTPNDLIKVSVVNQQTRKLVGESETRGTKRRIQPVKARIRRPHG
jgi:DNA-binding Xre family transcriptional regulator